MAPDLGDARVYERPLSREELLASGYIQTQERQDELWTNDPSQSFVMEDPRYMEELPSPPMTKQGYAQPSSLLDPQYARQCPPFEQPYMEVFQTSPSLEQPRLSRIQYASSPQMDQHYVGPAQPRMLDHQHEVRSQGPAMHSRNAAADPDDPTVLLTDAKDLLDDRFYGPFQVIGDWVVDPVARHLSDGVTLVFEGAAALHALSDPMVHGVQQAANEVAGNLKTAADFVGVTMEFQRCPCGGSILAGELYCPKCGAPRQFDHNAYSQDHGGDMGSQLREATGPSIVERHFPEYAEGPSAPPSAPAVQTLQPQYPTYSGMFAEGFPTIPRSTTLDNGVKYARVLSEAEVVGPGPFGSQSLDFTSQSFVRSSNQGIGAPPLNTMPASIPGTWSSGVVNMPSMLNATTPHLVAGGQMSKVLDYEPQGGVRLAAVVD
mmetsp:Transcript_122547/g.357862  ORF Transcript_122547/g.357862 Transcript_122547/m.357862 type:complete len:433 (+) Transcript_122547:49-1347(+)